MGGVRPLGGGLFAGRRTARSIRSALALRHRVPAAIITAAVLAVAGLTWSTSHGTRTVEQAQAVGAAAPTAEVPQGTVCAVRYQLKHDSGRDYEAQLTVAATDAVADEPWRVQFAYPGSQHLVSQPKAVTQKGRKVTVKGHGKLRAFTLRGDYRGVNALPISFTLDGHRCRAEVLGSITAAGSSDDQDGVSEAAAPEKQGGQGGGAPSGKASSSSTTSSSTQSAPIGSPSQAGFPAARSSAGSSTAEIPSAGSSPAGSSDISTSDPALPAEHGSGRHSGTQPTPSALPAKPLPATVRDTGAGRSVAL